MTMATGMPWSSFFVERDSLQSKQFQALVVKEPPACEVVLSCDPDQAAVLTLRRRGKAGFLMIQGGLADGRAAQLLSRLRGTAGSAPFQWVAFADRRHCRGELLEPAPEAALKQIQPALEAGWVLVRFLEPKQGA